MRDRDFVVDPEIKALIPSLKPDEMERLKESIRNEGCRDPLIIWADKDVRTLIDGHHRLEICEALGIDYKTKDIEFLNRDYAKLWIIINQLARRNLNEYHFKLLVGQEFELKKGLRGGDRESEGYKKAFPQSEGMVSETAEKIAKEHNISKATVERSAALFKAHEAIKEIAPEVAEKLENKEIKAKASDIRAIAKALKDEKLKDQVATELKEDFYVAAKTATNALVEEAPAEVPEPTPEPTPEELKALKEHSDSIKEPHECSREIQGPPDLRLINMLADVKCPKCGKPALANVMWVCCRLTIKESAEMAEAYSHKLSDELGQKARAERLARDARVASKSVNEVDLESTNKHEDLAANKEKDCSGAEVLETEPESGAKVELPGNFPLDINAPKDSSRQLEAVAAQFKAIGESI